MYQQNYPQGPKQTVSMSFGAAIQKCFNNYANFNGRASVAEYWWWFLFQWVCCGVASWISDWLGGAVSLALVLPTLAVSWRRMHDIGKGGGWWFINLIPLIGWIWWIILAVKSSEMGDNRFGPEP